MERDLAWRASWFGFGAALASSAGQTFFIGLFGHDLRSTLALDEATFGGLYSLATIASALTMFWLGAIADRIRLASAMALALGIVACGAALIAVASTPLTLAAALFLLRLGGQGLTGHFAIVAAVRFGGARAGRGVSTAAFGFILGEAAFPFLVLQALGLMHWRSLWWLVAGAVLVALFGLYRAAAPFPAPAAYAVVHGRVSPVPLGRRRLLVTPAFIAALSVLLVSPFVVTAVFLHQGTLAMRLDWPAGSLPGAFLAFAAAQAGANFGYGRLVDRAGALAAVMVYLLPLGLGLLAMALLDGRAGLWLGFMGLGLAAGGQGVVGGAIWLALFGPAQLGLVRGTYAAMMVLASAISPWLLGQALVDDVSLVLLAAGITVYVVLIPIATGPLLAIAARAQEDAPDGHQ